LAIDLEKGPESLGASRVFFLYLSPCDGDW